MQDLQPQFIQANGIEFAYLAMGEGPLVLCLHGFPDTAFTYLDLMQRLSREGYRVVAPFTRGYAPTGIPADGRYTVKDFGKDVLALIAALGEERAYLIGHDWGATAVYAAASMGPERILKAVTAAVPHPLAMKFTPQQLKKSWYMFFFQLPYIAERAVRKNNFALIDRLWSDWSPLLTSEDSLELIAALKQSLAEDRNLLAALGYYRELFKPTNFKQTQRLFDQPISVPTLTIAGEFDGCIGAEHFPLMKPFFSQKFELKIMPGAGHFMHQEQPDQFSDAIIQFFISKDD